MSPHREVAPIVAPDLPPDVPPRSIASPSCSRCSGNGVITGRLGHQTCPCGLRQVFRRCLATYQHCQATMGTASVQYERVGHAQGRCLVVASFKRAEYAADFVLAARRALASRPVESAVFEHFLLTDRPWHDALPVINRQLALPRPLNRGTLFHAAYRAQELVGRAILAASPYRIFPACSYFAGFVVPQSMRESVEIPW